MTQRWTISTSSSKYFRLNLTATTTTLASVSITPAAISSLSDIYDPRITRPFLFICLFIGSIGNSLSFIVFSQKQLRIHSTFRYLAYLSIVDLMVLYLGLGNLILRDYFHIDIREKNLFLCKLHTFLTYVTTHLSSWILTMVSIDRAIACTVVPLYKRICLPKSADRIFLIMCIIISLINSHILLFMGSKQTTTNQPINPEKITCTHNTSDAYFLFFEKPYNTLDLCIYVLIPFLIMTMCTSLIAYRLFCSLSQRNMNRASKGKSRNGIQRAKQISYMLLILNLVFVLLLAPAAIAQVSQQLHEEYRYRLFNSITLILSYTNHALNFVLYGIASPQFRLTLRQLLGFVHNDNAPRRSHTAGFFTSVGL